MPKPYEVEAYLNQKGLKFRRRGQKAELHTCPFCNGGEHKDYWKCVVYMDADGGNYKCMRGSCAVSGSFWQLVEHFGDDPKPYFADKHVAYEKKPFVYKTEPVNPLPFTEIALKYLHARGFSDDTLAKVPVWCNDEGNICFGFYQDGDLCFVKERLPRKEKDNEPKAWAAWKSGLRKLWGIEDCDPEISSLIITFGEYDRMAVMEAGLDNVVSVPSGDTDLEWINICFDDLARFESITLWADNDKSGKECVPKIADRLGKHRIRVVCVEGVKDANEMLAYGKRDKGEGETCLAMWNAVADAEWYWRGDIVEVADIAETEQCFDGYLGGIQYLDQTLGGFLFHRMTVHLGDTKHGKTDAVTQLVLNALTDGGRACIWTGEDSAEDYKYKVQVHLAGYEGTEIRVSKKTGRDYAWIKPDYKQRIDEYLRGKLYFLDRRRGVTEDILLENFELAYKRWGCDIFVLDNLMKAVASKDTQNIFHRQTQIVNAYSDFTKSYRVHGHLVVHTNKTGDPLEPPTRNSSSGAKEIINLADTVIGWWRIPEKVKDQYGNGDALASILANRVFGEEGHVVLRYDAKIRRFSGTPVEAMRAYAI